MANWFPVNWQFYIKLIWFITLKVFLKLQRDIEYYKTDRKRRAASNR